VDGIAGRPGDDARRELGAVSRRADWIADHLVDGLGEAVEFADVEIDPARRIVRRLARDQHDFRLDDTGVADEAAARLDDRLWNGVAETLAQRAEDRAPVGLELRRLAQVARREAAAEVDGGGRDAALGAGTGH